VSFVCGGKQMDKKFTTLKNYSHKVGINYWHIEFATKYRYKMFGKFKQKNLEEAAIRNVAFRHKMKIHELFVMPEHVHMLITLPHDITDSKALMLLKGGSAFIFFKHHPKSRFRLPQGHLWSAGGCATTVGYNDVDTVSKYILNQGEHHALV
jgi:putative transposase